MESGPSYHSILVVDVEGSGRRADQDRPSMRNDLYVALMTAFARVGIAWDTCKVEDRGDGIYALIPPAVPKPVLAGRLLDEIDRILADFRGTDQELRLRLSLHAGEVSFDRHGSSGQAVDTAFVLLDANEVRRELRAMPEVRCVLVVSAAFHSALDQHGVPWSEQFRPLPVRTKRGDWSAWISVPDRGLSLGVAEPVGCPQWQGQVGVPDRPATGWGVLVAPRSVLTCGHLIPGGRGTPYGISVALGAGGSRQTLLAEVSDWVVLPGGGPELTVLELDSAPRALWPARLAPLGRPRPGRAVCLAGLAEQPAEILGPDGANGELVRLRYSVSQAGQAVSQAGQAASRPGQAVSRPGRVNGNPRDFRYPLGMAVVDAATGDVVGLLVGDHQATSRSEWRQAVMAPIEVVARCSPVLSDALRGRRVNGSGGARGTVTLMEFAKALAKLKTLETEAGRNTVLGLLRPEIAGIMPRYPQPRFDVLSLVRTCQDYTNGLDDLIGVLLDLEGDSERLREVIALRSRLAG